MVASCSSLRVMELRSRRRRLLLGAQPPRGSRRRFRGGDDDDGVDRISGLSDDLLIQILVRLRCAAAAAARTSILSHRWRDSGLWKHLPDLCFRGIAYDALEAALAQVALPKLSLLDVSVSDCRRFRAGAFASLLRTIAGLVPLELSIAVCWVNPMPIELPCFARATSITLNVTYLHLAPPSAGELPVLERLSIARSSERFDTRALVSRCPRLRVLELIRCWDLDYITVHSATLEELVVIGDLVVLRGVDIVAPVLKKFTLRGVLYENCSVSLLTPTVENLSWHCRFPCCIGYGREPLHGSGTWYLNGFKLETEERGFVLGLDIGAPRSETLVQTLQEMFQFPNISVLELCTTLAHVYGALVLKLIRTCKIIQRLKLVTRGYKWRSKACPPSCPCYQQQINWRSQNLSSTGLEEVEIEIFTGSDHNLYFLKLLFRCAPLKKVTVKLAPNVVASSRGCKEAYKNFKANPGVECHVYGNSGEEVIYA